MLCADHIGFHLYAPGRVSNRAPCTRSLTLSHPAAPSLYYRSEWARNFLASCRRLLAVTFEARRGGGLTVSYNGRSIAVTITHMGVEPSLLLQKLPAPAVVRAAQKLRAAFGNAAVISSVDMLEGLKGAVPSLAPRRCPSAHRAPLTPILYSTGVPLKLLAFEHFLHLHPHRAGSVVLALYGIVPDARPDDVHACRREVTALVARINGRFPRAVYFHELRSLPLVERIALWQATGRHCLTTLTSHHSHHPPLSPLWQATDLLFVSSVREGLNLMPFEYLLAREGNPGALLLSEFSSVARVLSGAVTTNPFSIKKVGLAIETALSLPPDERARRAAADLASTRLDSTSAWARRVLLDVTRAARPAGAEGGARRRGWGSLGWRAARSGTGQLATGMARRVCALLRHLSRRTAASRRLILLAASSAPSPAADATATPAPTGSDPPTPPGRAPRPASRLARHAAGCRCCRRRRPKAPSVTPRPGRRRRRRRRAARRTRRWRRTSGRSTSPSPAARR